MIQARPETATPTRPALVPASDRWSSPLRRPLADQPSELDRALDSLSFGRVNLGRMSPAERIDLVSRCVDSLDAVSDEWVDQCCAVKGISSDSPCRAEEMLNGPVAVMRQLQLFLQTMRHLDCTGLPKLPGRLTERRGRMGVQVVPCDGHWDWATFFRFRGTTWLQPGVTRDNVSDHLAPAWKNLDATGVSLVLSAGNVSAIPATDMLSRLCVENRVVLLKMSPVNSGLGPILSRAFAPLIEQDLLRIIYGDKDVGAAAIADCRVDDVHITGSVDTYNSIVWGSSAAGGHRQQRRIPVIQKPVTSELGSVSPWIVVPGAYSRWQSQQQAANLAGSLVNNAGFNCVSTRVIVTWKQWPEREAFMDRVRSLLASIPQRVAYYPGAMHRFTEFSGVRPDIARAAISQSTGERASANINVDGTTIFVAGTHGNERTLPWTMIRNVSPSDGLLLFGREAFTSVCAEVVIDATSPEEFFRKAVDFANEQLWGTLAVSMTVPSGFRRQQHRQLFDGIDHLRYGVVSINQWAALLFAMMAPPWGGSPFTTPEDIQSGTGWVHNSLMLTGIEKTVLEAPLVVQPKPIWQPVHSAPVNVSRALFRLSKDPSAWNLARLTMEAVRGGLAGIR